MKIKVKKQLRLDELIKYIFDSGIEDKNYDATVFNNTSEVRISGSGNIKINGYINKHTTFTVEVEEELTEGSEFKRIIALYQDCGIPRSFDMSGASIREIKNISAIRCIEPLKIFIYTDELIEVWSKEHGIPEEGVLEVD